MNNTMRIILTMSIILLAVAATGCGSPTTLLSTAITPVNTSIAINNATASDTPLPTTQTLSSTPKPSDTPLSTPTATPSPTPLPTRTATATEIPLPTSTPTLAFDFSQVTQIMLNNGLHFRTSDHSVCPVYQFCSVYMDPYDLLIVTVLDDKSFLFMQKHYTSGSTAFRPLLVALFGTQVADAIYQNQGYLETNGYAIKIYAPHGTPYLSWSIFLSPGMTLDMLHATEASWGS